MPKVKTATEERATLVQDADDSKVGSNASAKAPVPKRSRWRWEPVRTEIAKPSAFVLRKIRDDWFKGALLNMDIGISGAV